MLPATVVIVIEAIIPTLSNIIGNLIVPRALQPSMHLKAQHNVEDSMGVKIAPPEGTGPPETAVGGAVVTGPPEMAVCGAGF